MSALTDAIDKSRSAAYPFDRFEGRGIVTCAGGLRYFTCAFVLISVLRKHFRCSLPIQVWHLGGREITDEMRLLLSALDVELVDAETVVSHYPARIAGGWPLKPYAIANSRFREVLFFDADVVPLQDPVKAFDWDGFREHGLQLWPDKMILRSDNPIWAQVGLEPRDAVSVESGLLMADKARVWNVLSTALALNEYSEEIYRSIYGDKDTFLIAALSCGLEPNLVTHRPLIFGSFDLVQRDPNGEPFAHHRSESKWSVNDANDPVAIRDMQRPCDEAIADLAARWSGSMFQAPDRSPQALAQERQMIATGRFQYQVSGGESQLLELHPGGRIVKGRGALLRHWAVIERDGVLVLQLYSSHLLTAEMTVAADGVWTGARLVRPRAEISLVNSEQRRTWPHADEARTGPSCKAWLDVLLDTSFLAAGFSAHQAVGLFQALQALNARFDDVAERLADMQDRLPPAWRGEASGWVATLGEQRDNRIALVAPLDYTRSLECLKYDQHG